MDIITAAYCHDLLEDTDVTYKKLIEHFGVAVAGLVQEVTCDRNPVGGKTFPMLKSQKGIMLKFADRLSNISRMKSWSDKRKKKYLESSVFWKK